MSGPPGLELYNSINVHAVQPIVAISDTLVSARPWKVGHAYLAPLFVILYVLFQILYVYYAGAGNEFGQKYIYVIVKWTSEFKKSTVVSFALVAMAMFAHIFICLLVYGRDKSWHRINKGNETAIGEKEHKSTETMELKRPLSSINEK